MATNNIAYLTVLYEALGGVTRIPPNKYTLTTA